MHCITLGIKGANKSDAHTHIYALLTNLTICRSDIHFCLENHPSKVKILLFLYKINNNL